MTGDKDPNGIDPHDPGAKLDSGKPPINQGVIKYFPRAIAAVAQVSAYGAQKYSWGGWESVPGGIYRYQDALVRHIVDDTLNPTDTETGLLHAAHTAWNALAVLELKLRNIESARKGHGKA